MKEKSYQDLKRENDLLLKQINEKLEMIQLAIADLVDVMAGKE